MKQILIALAWLAAACAPSAILLVHPKTGERVVCKGSGNPHPVMAISDSGLIRGCTEQYEGLGFIRADNLTPEQRANLVSKPTPIGIEQDITIRAGEPRK